MKLKPLNDHVILEVFDKEEITKSGIVIPDTAEKEKPSEGKVVAVGSGRVLADGKRSPLSVKVGDKVVFTKYGPTEIKVKNKEYLVAKEEDILAVIED
jgi:chaperonin GroES